MVKLGSLTLGRGDYSPIGLDIGTTSIKMAQLQRTAKGWKIRDMIVKEINLSNNENGGTRKDAVIQTIQDGIKESSFTGKSVVSVMPGYQLDIVPVKLSSSEDESLEEAILEEARAHLSYDVERAVIDYMPIGNSESDLETDKTARFLLISARREDVDEHLSILKEAKLKPEALDISASALARIIGFAGKGKNKNTLLINAGELHTTLTVLSKDTVIFDRNILWGRENMIENLMNRLKMDRQKASGLLSRVGLYSGHSGNAGQEAGGKQHLSRISEAVYEIIATQLEKMAKEIEKVVQYFSSEMRGASVDIIYLSGAGGTINDLDIYIGKRTGIRTEYFNPLRSLITGSNVSAHNNRYGSFFCVSLGLAMRGITYQDISAGSK